MNEDELNQETGLHGIDNLEADARAVSEPVGVTNVTAVPDEIVEDEVTINAGAAAPRVKKLVWSRELRGWMAGVSALVVAMAAIAPVVDLSDLRGAAELPDLRLVSGNESCSDEDQTSGTNGQHLKCDFTCPTEPGKLSISVDADDNDATVSGTANCGGQGGDNAHCSGVESCTQIETRTASGAGTCKADSDEAIDSGLYVECSASADLSKGPIDPVPTEFCPVTEPVKVCVQPVCAVFEGVLAEQCQVVWDRMKTLVQPYANSAGYWTNGEQGSGLVCFGYVCTPATPTCVTDLRGMVSCFI